MSKGSNSVVSIGFGGALFIVFLTLRLLDHIDWPWYWVAAPLWMPVAALLAILAIALLVAGIVWLLEPRKLK
jgi:hypothetical protein